MRSTPTSCSPQKISLTTRGPKLAEVSGALAGPTHALAFLRFDEPFLMLLTRKKPSRWMACAIEAVLRLAGIAGPTASHGA